MNELVSIIVPVYNKENTIEKCLDSLINQSYSNIEIIVINDGSTDSSKEMIMKYLKRNVVVYNMPNQGVSNARNFGIEKANGEYIVFVDADDYVGKLYVESLVTSCDEEIDLVIMGRKDVYKNFISNVYLSEYSGNFGKIPSEFFINGFCHPVWGKLYKRKIIELNKIKFPKINISEDSFFNIDYLKCSKNVKLINLQEYFYVHSGNQNLSSIAKYEYFIIYEKLYFKYKDYFNNMDQDYSNEIIYPQFYNLILKVIKNYPVKEIKKNKDLNNIFKNTMVIVFSKVKTSGLESVIKLLIMKKKWRLLKILLYFI